MKKNKILIILLVVIGLLICLSLYFLVPRKYSDNKNKLSDGKYIVDIKKNKEDKLFFINDTKKNCFEKCKVSRDNLKILRELYGLEYITIEKKGSSDEYNKFISTFNIDESIIDSPTLFIIKKGEFVLSTTALVLESLKEDLKKYKLINYPEEDNISYDEFIKVFNKKEKNIVFMKYDDINSERVLIELNKLSKEYDFKYSSCTYGLVDSLKVSSILAEQVGEDFGVPVLLIVKDKKILDYSYENDIYKIKDFLKKHNFIK